MSRTLLDLAARAAALLPPETAHRTTVRALKTGLAPHAAPRADLPVALPRSGLRLPNPVGLAAGFDKNAEVFAPMLGLGFGFVECGTVTPRPQAGNPRPRLFRLKADEAVINRMGFNNDGLAAFAARLGARRPEDGVVGANVGANKDSEDRIADYETGLRAVLPLADYAAVNISSPNTPGLRGLQDRGALETLLARCGVIAGPAGKPVFLKVAPDLDDAAIDDICEVLADEGAWLAGLIVSNTTLARPDSLKSPEKTEAGGLSGAPLLAPSTAVLRAFAERLGGRFDLIGAGGVASGADAYAKIRAGARAVQLYSALVYDGPGLVGRIVDELAALLARDGYASVADAVGADLAGAAPAASRSKAGQ